VQSLQKDHITDLFVWLDDLIKDKKLVSKSKVGRPSSLTDSEITTLVIWNVLFLHQKTIQDLYNYSKMHLESEFPNIPTYNAFLDHCHRITGILTVLLQSMLNKKSAIKFADSTMIEVCKLHRVDDYKVAKDLVAFGKNWQGWHFGFKLHAAIDPSGILCSIALTPADMYDAQMLPKLNNCFTKYLIGDSHYGAKAMREYIYERDGTIILSPPHYKQRTKVATFWQNALLSMRSKIESVYDILKNHLNLVTSFPRSAKGYIFHYLRILIGYQIMTLSRIQS